ncbi:MAG: HRDC domain-containing protein [Beijerinckiaceae bacterium]
MLRGEVPVAFRSDTSEPKSARRRDGPRNGATPDRSLSSGDEPLFQALRARRLELAREQGVPPYVIFHDATLLEMVRRKPTDLAAMGEIPGVGRNKLNRYGATFLAAIAGSIA